jgi:hypothetical protein
MPHLCWGPSHQCRPTALARVSTSVRRSPEPSRQGRCCRPFGHWPFAPSLRTKRGRLEWWRAVRPEVQRFFSSVCCRRTPRRRRSMPTAERPCFESRGVGLAWFFSFGSCSCGGCALCMVLRMPTMRRMLSKGNVCRLSKRLTEGNAGAKPPRPCLRTWLVGRSHDSIKEACWAAKVNNRAG